MEASYNYSSRFFALDDSSLFILRRPFKKLPLSEVQFVRVCTGTDNKRPMLSSVIGACLVIVALYNVFSMFSDYESGFFENPASRSIRWIGNFIFMIGFLGGIGILLLYRSMPIHPILEVTFIDGTTEHIPVEDENTPEKKKQLLEELARAFGKEKVTG